MSKKRTVYICGVDWQHELDNSKAIDLKFFMSVEALKRTKKCWDECGIIKCEIEFKEWVEPQDLLSKIRAKGKRNKNE